MRIKNFRKTKIDSIEKALATVIFEDSDRAPADVFFHTSEEYAKFLDINPDAFLLAGYLSAMYVGEKRILIEGKVDESLKKSLLRNMKTFQKWYGYKYNIVPIESDNKELPQSNNSNLNKGLFFSGGVDSIYSLRTNRLKYKADHSLYIKDCFIVNGFDMNRTPGAKDDPQIFERAFNSAKKITDEAQANLIPVHTNLRHHFYGDGSFWPNWHHGAALAAVGHCFTSKINSVIIASSHATSNIEPWGSHPQIDPNYGNASLKIIHDELCSIFQKVQLISKWETGFQNIRTCYHNDEKYPNCCHCEKCIKIMIMLMALGILENCQAFPKHHIPTSLLKDILMIQTEADFKVNYLQLAPFLEKHGHKDLAGLILKENRLKSKLRRFDQRYFQGKLKKIINSSY